MSVPTAPRPLAFDNSFERELHGLYQPWQASPAPQPTLLLFNSELANELGAQGDTLRTPYGVEMLVGNVVPEGATPLAQAYSGHQFGGFNPRLGDGRALLIGEVIDERGDRRDLHLKGSGRTPFARGGDGKAAVGPMLREYIMGEAMHALAIPTTRALAVIATGEYIARDAMLPGAVLARVAASHLRVGSFQYAAASNDQTLLRRLADYAIDRHYPHSADADQPYLALYAAVVEAQAALVAQWMLVGFVHGVMNTDNMTISGETIDYGPCAFMDVFDPATVFSSIDHSGRYAYGNQPNMAQWNLARLGESLLALLHVNLDTAVAAATDVVASFPDRYHLHWMRGMRTKLGIGDERTEDVDLINDLLSLLHDQHVDYTSCFRAFSSFARGEREPATRLFPDQPSFDAWSTRWSARLHCTGRDPELIASAMDRVNPIYVPRNHLVEAALMSATDGDLADVHQLLDVVTRPFDERSGFASYAEPAPAGSGPYRTFCGT